MTFSEVATPAPRRDGAPVRYPLSSQQELWCEQPGAYGPRFIVTRAIRVTGAVDVAALQGALDDVVARHEILRTIVVPEGKPPYQEVHPPAAVALEIRDRPTDDGSRDDVAEDLLTEAERSSVPTDRLPLLRATLVRFDDHDGVLTLVTHHTACDGWSLHLLVRDLAGYYAARTGERPLELPVALQYHDYTRWQLERVTGPTAAENMAYWHRELGDAKIFTLPTDRPVPRTHTLAYSSYGFELEPAVVATTARLAKSLRCSSFMVMLAAFSVLAHRISGSPDPVVNTMIHGRGQPQFADTMGPFLNFLALRTDLAACTSFRDVVRHTRNTCLEAYAHEVPINLIEREIPSLMAPLAEPYNCDFIFGYFESPFSGTPTDPASDPFRIGQRSTTVRKRERISEEMPGGAAWSMGVMATGEVNGTLQFNPEEFDEPTAVDWVTEYCRLVVTAIHDPDRDWKAL